MGGRREKAAAADGNALNCVLLRSPCRLHGDEVRWGDAADVGGVLHSALVRWRQALLGCLLGVRQDYYQGEGEVYSFGEVDSP